MIRISCLKNYVENDILHNVSNISNQLNFINLIEIFILMNIKLILIYKL